MPSSPNKIVMTEREALTHRALYEELESAKAKLAELGAIAVQVRHRVRQIERLQDCWLMEFSAKHGLEDAKRMKVDNVNAVVVV